ncbi:MAG: UDP-N-acetylglucosamine 1-carboxyvinyltransferase [Planctomycetota bacterium]|jgi:UDP-N-acetylglucosamine 1-carboxyvinyltransferase|nr:UDP-N-acetylglucosamine 1-carboxyvinyltransferase [Planctomycetota bacterium]
MDAFRIIGGKKLSGSIAVRGAKNAALPILATCLLTDSPCRYRNVPLLRDIQTQVKILNTLGVETQWSGRSITTRLLDTYNSIAPYELVKTMRAGVVALGPLLAKRGECRVSLPGGCVIGERPIDLHLRGLEALGAEINVEHGDIYAKAPKGGLRGAEIYLGGTFGSSVTATANVMMAATLATGTTVIECAACEPEVVDLANCLNAMGARISGAGSPTMTIKGVRKLRGADWTVIPDRIEAATFLVLGAMTRSPITVTGARYEHMMAFCHVLRQMGVQIERKGRSMTVVPSSKRYRGTDFVTLPFPAFPTDCQAQTMALACIAEGTSVITERIYPERFMHAAELKRMGASIQVSGGQAIVQGTAHLEGTEVMASDLRASAALVNAACAAKGESLIRRIYHVDRGYERIEERLSKLGASIERVDAEG